MLVLVLWFERNWVSFRGDFIYKWSRVFCLRRIISRCILGSRLYYRCVIVSRVLRDAFRCESEVK